MADSRADLRPDDPDDAAALRDCIDLVERRADAHVTVRYQLVYVLVK
jgi:hypothetical protein